ncbi:16962_t:CDS:1, partial [Racocetra fulgida]
IQVHVSTIKLQNLNDTECEPSAKHKRSEESYEYVEDLPEVKNVDSTVDCEPEITENNLAKNNKPRKNLTRNRKKGKERPIRTTRNHQTSQHLDQETVDSDKE